MEKYLILDVENDFGGDAFAKEFYGREENNPYAREPGLALMPDGSLICVAITGGPTEPHNKNVVIMKKSRDGGKTWNDARILFKHSMFGVMSTEIFTGFERPMIVVSTYNADCPAKHVQTFVSYTDDCGDTWTEPVSINPMMTGATVRRGFRMSNGEVLFPFYYTVTDNRWDWNKEEYYNETWWNGVRHEVSVAVTADNGKSYERHGRIFMKDVSLWEPNCAELEQGHVVMFIRCEGTGRLGRADSYDFGKTWSEPILTDMPNAGSEVTAFTIGNKLFVIANWCSTKRTHLEMRISTDGGKTFDSCIPLDDNDKRFCYTRAIVDESAKKLYVAYENYKQHYLKIFSFEELGI